MNVTKALLTAGGLIVALAASDPSHAQNSNAAVPPAKAPETNGRFVVYVGGSAERLWDPSQPRGQVSAPIPATILVDTMTGRSWALVKTPFMRWEPVHFRPTPMAGDGKTLTGGQVLPPPIQPDWCVQHANERSCNEG